MLPAIEGRTETVLTATLRKGRAPVFFDELTDVLEAQDAEENGCIARRYYASVARPSHDRVEAELYSLAQ